MEIELNFRTILKTAVVTQWLILIVYVCVSRDTTWRSDIGVLESVLNTLIVIACTISSIGLFFIKPWAIWLYTILFAIGLVLDFVYGPIAEYKSDLAIVIGYLSDIPSFVIIILCVLFLVNFRGFRLQITGER